MFTKDDWLLNKIKNTESKLELIKVILMGIIAICLLKIAF